jgi:hypothetical protein
MALSIGNISELIAKKNYVKAIEVIKEQLKAGKHNPQMHIQLADVLILAKKEREAIQILTRVADDFASEGFEAKAIAVLKKIDRLEPGRKDVQSKLASLVKRPSAPTLSAARGGPSLEIGMEEIGFDAPSTSAPVSVPAARFTPPPREEPELPSFVPSSEPAGLDLGLEGAALDLGLDARPPAPPPAPVTKKVPVPPRPEKPAPPKPAPVQDLDFGEDEEPVAEPEIVLEPTDEPAPVEVEAIEVEPEAVPEEEALEALPLESAGGDSGAFDDLFTQELMGAIDEAFQGGGDAPTESQDKSALMHDGDFTDSPLFKGFAQEELVAILEGLTLHTFEAGDIILAQGAPGHSLFILTTGVVKAFVKDEYGSYRFVKDLAEGSFFGEAAIITGQPRMATITAATHCELLELDRGTLDAISISHPHVQEVLQQFYEERMKGLAR